MAITPESLGLTSGVMWNVPQEIATRTDINHIKIWKSTTSECAGYILLTTIDTGAGGNIVTSYVDATQAPNTASYLITFVASTPAVAPATEPTVTYESNYATTYPYPTPRELRLIEAVKRAMPDVLTKCGVGLSDSDYMVGLNLALGIFNTYPPETYFRLCDLPRSHEYFIVGLAQLTTLASRFLTISIRDWNYSEPGGVVMAVDRGAKINQALQIIGQVYTQYLPLVKLDFSSDLPTGVGTIQLPLSMGGVVSRGLLGVLDIFTATGR